VAFFVSRTIIHLILEPGSEPRLLKARAFNILLNHSLRWWIGGVNSFDFRAWFRASSSKVRAFHIILKFKPQVVVWWGMWPDALLPGRGGCRALPPGPQGRLPPPPPQVRYSLIAVRFFVSSLDYYSFLETVVQGGK